MEVAVGLARSGEQRAVARRGGALVARVRRGSPAARAGVRPGDRLLAIDRLRPRDAIDLAALGAESDPDLTLDNVQQVRTTRGGRMPGEDLGVEFAAPTLDGVRRCSNA